ncbi:MAG: phage tail-like protein [Roseivirga sp.]|jgi:phage tail-like protein
MATYNPPTSFYFSLSIDDSTENAASFQEASGINGEMNIPEISEGGENRFQHRVPTAAEFANLVLKRGLVSADSALIKWCQQTLSGGLATPIQTKNMKLSLLNEKGQPTISWAFINAYPVKWSVSELNAMENSIAMETLEFAYSYFQKV